MVTEPRLVAGVRFPLNSSEARIAVLKDPFPRVNVGLYARVPLK